MENVFGNGNTKTNGELYFFRRYKKYMKIIFDVGSHYHTIYTRFER